MLPTDWTSAEYRTDVVTGYYKTLLHRVPDAAGLSFGASSALDLDDIRSGIEGTPEFFTVG